MVRMTFVMGMCLGLWWCVGCAANPVRPECGGGTLLGANAATFGMYGLMHCAVPGDRAWGMPEGAPVVRVMPYPAIPLPESRPAVQQGVLIQRTGPLPIYQVRPF